MQRKTDLDRILEIPIWAPDLDAVTSKWNARVRGPGADWSLRPDQALYLEAVEVRAGALPALGVGAGKTLCALLAPTAAKVDPARTLILCPARVRSQYYTEYAKYLSHGFLVGDAPPTIASYAALSRVDELDDLVEGGEIDLIVADEAHFLSYASSKAQRSGRTKKIERFFGRNPECQFVAMSATLTTTSIYDYAHLSEWALGDGTPLPTSRSRLEGWSRVLDSERTRIDGPPEPEHWWSIRDLWAEGSPFRPEDAERLGATDLARAAFHHRLVTCPGVVRSLEASCDQPLLIREIRSFPGSKALAAIAKRVEKKYELPDGTEIDDPLQVSSKVRQISQGFYYAEDWEDDEVDWEWKEARSDWGREVTRVLRNNRRGLDTPGEVVAEILAGRPYDADLAGAWYRWDAIRSERPGPGRRVEWLEGGRVLLDDVEARVEADGRRVLVWYSYEAVADALETRGVYVVRPGEDVDPEGPRVVGVSVASHSTGLNLQSYDVHCVLCPPANGSAWEQLIGRIHRAGREAPVEVWAYTHTPALKKALTSAKADAKYVHRTQGLPMRLLAADYEEERG